MSDYKMVGEEYTSWKEYRDNMSRTTGYLSHVLWSLRLMKDRTYERFDIYRFLDRWERKMYERNRFRQAI